jgi:hypothetical protein
MLGIVLIAGLVAALGLPALAHGATFAPQGELDCNGFSPIQQSVHRSAACTDIRGFAGVANANNWDSRFYDNGHYIGHDEPDMTFLSKAQGSGNDVTWTETLPRDPTAAVTNTHPGSDVSHWFELSIAPWFSMAMCDPNSYPQNPCTPESDANAPDPCTIPGTCPTGFTGGGGAFMEMQFYPPGFAPNVDGISCDNTHWCSALTIDSLECTYGFAFCNGNCEEPVNFAFIQHNGVPAGPPSPQEATLATHTQNRETLLMKPGDKLVIHMGDAPVPHQRGVRAFEVEILDLTTHQFGFMQASAANGFMNSDLHSCAGTPFNFQPEYNTASRGNITPWAALETDISTQFEIGHWESCSTLSGGPVPLPLFGTTTDTTFLHCNGPYEDTAQGGDGTGTVEPTDAPCFLQGDTHGTLNTAPDTTTGCIDEITQNGDLDFDGSPYWPEWPVDAHATAKLPGSFMQALPTTFGRPYPSFFLQTDLALSESTCTASTAGCAVPPPNGPGQFYPYWSRASQFGGECVIEFGNVFARPGVNDLGKDAQYGTDQQATLGYPEFIGPILPNNCGSKRS